MESALIYSSLPNLTKVIDIVDSTVPAKTITTEGKNDLKYIKMLKEKVNESILMQKSLRNENDVLRVQVESLKDTIIDSEEELHLHVKELRDKHREFEQLKHRYTEISNENQYFRNKSNEMNETSSVNIIHNPGILFVYTIPPIVLHEL